MTAARLGWGLACLWALPGLAPGAAGWADARVLFGFAVLMAAPCGAWLGWCGEGRPRRTLGLLSGGLAGLAAALALTRLLGPPALEAPGVWVAALVPAGLLASGLALGAAACALPRGRASALGAGPWRLCAGLWLAGLFLLALPTRAGMGGEAWARKAPASAALVFGLSPWTVALEAAGVDWMRHPAVYSAAGTDWISGARRGPTAAGAAFACAGLGLGLLGLLGLCRFAARLSRASERRSSPASEGPPEAGPS